MITLESTGVGDGVFLLKMMRADCERDAGMVRPVAVIFEGGVTDDVLGMELAVVGGFLSEICLARRVLVLRDDVILRT